MSTVTAEPSPTPALERILVLACGALAREVLALVRANAWTHVDVHCLPAKLHLVPDRIPAAVDTALATRGRDYDRVLVAYADCGTNGALEPVLAAHGATRLDGLHCYGFFAGDAAWRALQEEEPGTLYLPDFLARHVDALVIRPLGLDRHPELVTDVFGNYRRLVYLAQTDDAMLTDRARETAERLGLAVERRFTGYGERAPALAGFVERRAA
jgi:hypothetical protein